MNADTAENADAHPRCWWCGGIADSGEHKFKRSDLVRAFGSGQWMGDDAVAHGVAGRLDLVNSSRSHRLKFDRVLCRDCNTRRSQPFDQAYDHFAAYFDRNKREIYARAALDWSDVFGHSWQEDRERVTGYWVKHIGCRLAVDGVPLVPSLAAFLNGTARLTNLVLQLEIRSDIAAVSQHMEEVHGSDAGSFWMGDAEGEYSQSRGHFVKVSSHWGLEGLRLNYVYDLDDGRFATNFGADVVNLPTNFVFEPKTIQDLCQDCTPRRS